MAEFELKPKSAAEWLEIITDRGVREMLLRPPLSADEKAEHIRKYHQGIKSDKNLNGQTDTKNS